MTRLWIVLFLALALGHAEFPPTAPEAPPALPVLGHTPSGLAADRGVTLPLADARSARAVTGVATVRDDVAVRALEVDVVRERATVWFELRGERPVTVDALHWTFADGRERVHPAPGIRVVPPPSAVPDDAAPVWRRATRAPDAGLFLAAALTHDAADPLRVESLAFAPPEATAGRLLVRRLPAARLDRAWDAWTRALVAHLSDAWTARAHPAELDDLPGRLADGSAWLDPAALNVELQPGEALLVALTPASFVPDVRSTAIFSRPSIRVRPHGAARALWLPGPGVAEHTPR